MFDYMMRDCEEKTMEGEERKLERMEVEQRILRK